MFGIPSIILILAAFLLVLLWLIIFGLRYSSNTSTRTDCVRLADAINTFVSSNGGFADVGAGSFEDFLNKYLQTKPLHGSATVTLVLYPQGKTYNDLTTASVGGIKVSQFDVGESHILTDLNLVGNSSISTDILTDAASDAILFKQAFTIPSNVQGVLGTTTGDNYAENTVILDEGQCYQVVVTPKYVDMNVVNGDDGTDGGRSVVVTGRITNYTKNGH